jgi:hypothetical protein
MSEGIRSEFHAKNGWFFARTNSGSVRIRHEHFDSNLDRFMELSIELDESVWASVVASVSEEGETWERWDHIRKFHDGEEVT